MSGLTRFGVSIPDSLLADFDRLIARKGYQNRSEAIRDLIRDSLVIEEWKEGKKEMVGAISLVYSHHTRELSRILTQMQHDHYRTILSTLHIHLDKHNCLEVLVVKGKAEEIKKIGDRLVGTKGVKHGKISLTSTGKNLK
ncbi:MAG: nickel-responsive regulator [Deltaproteobacteria bacterium SM23_61]|nr:MAG: nickel-responsive regulator [Deltaproteobacteria bacterium SM23_61]